MKKVLTIVLLLITCVIDINIISANALNNFSDTIDATNDYISRFPSAEKYIIEESNVKFKYSSGFLTVDNRFISGGLLNLDEFNISINNNSSYLYTGTKYYTMTESGSNVYEISSLTPALISKDELSGFRVTEYVKDDIAVTGEGSYINPWVLAFDASNDFIVAFDSMGGIGGQKSSIIATKGQPMPNIITTRPIKEHYIFNGWYDSNGVQYYDADGQSARNYDKNTGTILYAKWTSKSVANVTSTNTMRSTTQIAMLNCKHVDGVVGYYWGTEPPTSSSTYTEITSTKDMNVEKTIDTIGTYYLSCKDLLGDVSLPVSITYYNYIVKDMLNNLNGSVTLYNTSNYSLVSTNTYIAEQNKRIVMQNASTPPVHSNQNKFQGYSLGDPSSTSVSLYSDSYELTTNNQIFTAWFKRNSIYVYYKVQSGENLVQGSSATGTYTQNNNGLILKDNEEYYDSFKYGSTTIELTDNSTSGQFAITRTGYEPAANAEWKCVGGCTTAQTTYKQSNMSITNTDLQMCDTSTNDCNIVVSSNFVSSVNDNNYIVRKFAGNLMEGNSLVNWGANLSGSGDLYTMTTSSTSLYDGAYISGDMFTSGKTYVLTYNIQKTSGTLKSIHGHSASTSQIAFKIDGIDSSIPYHSSGGVNNIANDTGVHSVWFEFTYNGNQSNNNIFIQPNRGYSDVVTVKITNLRLYEIVGSNSKNYNTLYNSTNLSTITKGGYTFDKWYNNSSYSTALNTSTRFTQTTATFEDINTNHSNANIYGHITPKTYTISYNANGGSGAPSSQTYVYSPAGVVNLSSAKPTRNEYKFLGWSLSNSATSASYSEGQEWRRSNVPSSGTTFTLYAVWAKYKCPYYSATLSNNICVFDANVTYKCRKNADNNILTQSVDCDSADKNSSPSNYCPTDYTYSSNTCSINYTCADGSTPNSSHQCSGMRVYSGTCNCMEGTANDPVSETVTNYTSNNCTNYCNSLGYEASSSNPGSLSASGYLCNGNVINNSSCAATSTYVGKINCSQSNYFCTEGYLDNTTCYLDNQASCNTNGGWSVNTTYYSCPYGTRNNTKCEYDASI